MQREYETKRPEDAPTDPDDKFTYKEGDLELVSRPEGEPTAAELEEREKGAPNEGEYGTVSL